MLENDLLKLSQLSIEKILAILDLAKAFKEGKKKVDYKGKRIVANLFFEPSTRTHYSFDVAAKRLGCATVNFSPESSSLTKGESLYDTVQTFAAFGVDAMVIRHREDNYFDQFLDKLEVPIINGGDGKSNHPTQSLLDLFTIYEEFGKFKDLKILIMGDIDHSRVAHTNIEVMERLGMKVNTYGPDGFCKRDERFCELSDVVNDVDVIMLLRVQTERHEDMQLSKDDYLKKFGLSTAQAKKMKKSAIIMHPAPFNRGVEIADELVEDAHSRIFKQMSNGVFVRMAVLNKTIGDPEWITA